jgi:hypothetical protein
VTNVAWFKVLGNGHGHVQATQPASIATSMGSKLAIHDTDVIVSGFYSGHPTGSITAVLPPLQFPGVHALYQVVLAFLVLLQPPRCGHVVICGV